jgi:alpha-ketoglutarate-dependent taurine dioxygenase
MTPICFEARDALKLVATRIADAKLTAFHWRAGDMLVIDNWHVLHGRGVAGFVPSPDRSIFRVAVQ